MNTAKKTLYVLLFVSLLSSCNNTDPIETKPIATSNSSKENSETILTHELFFDNMVRLCGQRYEGKMTYPVDGQDSFAGKLLVADFQTCSDTHIKIPFAVGENRSRTWIISKTSNGLQLKHDHRHEDGTPDKINLYGGNTVDAGSALSQSFHADEHTQKIIPEASTNVWTISFNENTDELIYHLERHQKPRFTAVLNLVD